jgi:hypothetical protein
MVLFVLGRFEDFAKRCLQGMVFLSSIVGSSTGNGMLHLNANLQASHVVVKSMSMHIKRRDEFECC